MLARLLQNRMRRPAAPARYEDLPGADAYRRPRPRARWHFVVGGDGRRAIAAAWHVGP